jgi:hypothetical protein
MANTGNKTKANAANPYSGRTSPTRKEWMGDCADRDAQKSQFPEDQQAKDYGGDDIAKGWFRDGDGNACDKPNFDNDKSRAGNAKPISTGGSNASKSPFSAAGRNIK